jgi:hypothetical protein
MEIPFLAFSFGGFPKRMFLFFPNQKWAVWGASKLPESPSNGSAVEAAKNETEVETTVVAIAHTGNSFLSLRRSTSRARYRLRPASPPEKKTLSIASVSN